MTPYLKGQLAVAAFGSMIVCWLQFGLPAYVVTAVATLAFIGYVAARFTLTWFSFSGYHAAAIGLVMSHALAPLAPIARDHWVAPVVVAFMAAGLLTCLSVLMPAPVSRERHRSQHSDNGP